LKCRSLLKLEVFPVPHLPEPHFRYYLLTTFCVQPRRYLPVQAGGGHLPISVKVKFDKQLKPHLSSPQADMKTYSDSGRTGSYSPTYKNLWVLPVKTVFSFTITKEGLEEPFLPRAGACRANGGIIYDRRPQTQLLPNNSHAIQVRIE
jgi:hypothetical protein